MQSCVNAFERWADVTRCLGLDERREAGKGFELGREDVKERSTEHVHSLNVGRPRINVRRSGRGVCGCVWGTISPASPRSSPKGTHYSPICLHTNASKHRTSLSSPTFSRNSKSVASVLNVSFLILLNMGLGSREVRPWYVSASRRGWMSDWDCGGRTCRRRRSFQTRGRTRAASCGAEGIDSRSTSWLDC